MVHAELQKFHQKLQDEHLAGLSHRVANMNRALESLRMHATSSDHTEIPDSILYTRDLPQIIGEISNNISRGLGRNSKEEDKEDCVRSMVVYCQAKNISLLLLANILATFESIGRNTRQIEDLLKSEMEDCHAVLGFLSNFGPICYLPSEGRQVYKIVALRENIESYQKVDAFREKLGMSKMRDLKSIRALSYAAKVRPFLTHIVPIAGMYPQPQMKNNHYFHRGISLNILSYYLVFLDIVILNIFTIAHLRFSLPHFLRIFCSPSHWSKYSRLFRSKKDNSIEK